MLYNFFFGSMNKIFINQTQAYNAPASKHRKQSSQQETTTKTNPKNKRHKL